MTAPDPLAELLAALERDGEVPLAWVVEHAPDGDLRRLWAACGDGRTLVGLAQRVAATPALVLATCACARMSLDGVAADDPRPRQAIEAAEAWARGEAATAVVDAAERAANAAYHASNFEAAYAAANGAAAVVRRPQLAMSAVRAVLQTVGDDDSTCHRLADLVRAHLPCPTLDQLRAAYARR